MAAASGPTIPPWAGRRRAQALDTVRRRGARKDLPCSICGQPINYQLRYPDGRSCSVQHIRSRLMFPALTWDPSNWAPAHLDCNKAAGDGTNPITNGDLGVITPLWQDLPSIGSALQGRLVVLLCGPPGAGKTTIAHQADAWLTVYDRDDPRWDSDTMFGQALSNLGRIPNARAVVIRAGATSTARAKTAATVGATHTFLVTVPLDEAAHRVTQRGRPDAEQTLAGVTAWWKRHDNADDTPPWPGWDKLLAP